MGAGRRFPPVERSVLNRSSRIIVHSFAALNLNYKKKNCRVSRPIAHFDGTSCGVLTFVAPRVSLSPALSRFVSVTDAALRDSANAVLFYFFYFFILCRSRGREGPWFAAPSVLYDPSVSGGRPRPRLPQICLQGSTPQHAQLLLGC